MLKFFLNVILKIIMGALSKFVVATVKDLESVDLTNNEKRDEAFKRISERVKGEGKDLKSRLINLAIESAVSLIK